MNGKLFSILFCFVCLVCSAFASTNYEELFKAEQIKRHIEIRRELEKDATPFLENAPPRSFVGGKIQIGESENLKSLKTSWMDFLTTFSLIDLIMGIFSVVALGLGTVYFFWRMNPFADKIEK